MARGLSFTLIENSINKKEALDYNNLRNEVMTTETPEIENNIDDMDNFVAMTYQYDEDYKKKDLEKIAEYYDISKRKKKKADLIQDICLFEINPINYEIVERRKTLWFYMEELSNDPILNKYILLD